MWTFVRNVFGFSQLNHPVKSNLPHPSLQKTHPLHSISATVLKTQMGLLMPGYTVHVCEHEAWESLRVTVYAVLFFIVPSLFVYCWFEGICTENVHVILCCPINLGYVFWSAAFCHTTQQWTHLQLSVAELHSGRSGKQKGYRMRTISSAAPTGPNVDSDVRPRTMSCNIQTRCMNHTNHSPTQSHSPIQSHSMKPFSHSKPFCKNILPVKAILWNHFPSQSQSVKTYSQSKPFYETIFPLKAIL